ncbi:MAG: PhoH family protein [Endomicrobiales bacterium]|jgi:phosphate starvation-inducible PhoH-like protein
MVTKKIFLKNSDEAVQILGRQDENIRRLEREYNVQIFVKQSGHAGDFSLVVRGAGGKVDKALAEIEYLRRDMTIDRQHLSVTSLPAEQMTYEQNTVYITFQGKHIKSRSDHQLSYIESFFSHDLVFGIGPAGTGKTFLAVAGALRALQAGKISRIVITRPVVEAGEKLGFLPGDLYEKINPYLKPLYDAFYFMVGPDRFRFLREEETIEIVPLAYMRGRTIDNAFIILDEAQNTTPEQMKMFLTRIGSESQVIVTGDVTQIDLDSRKQSGLIVAEKILSGIEGIKFVHFTAEDVVRHELVKKIIKAYENAKGKL